MTRAPVREAIFTELVNAASGSHTVTYDDGSTSTVTVSKDNIGLEWPDSEETLPGVFYRENYAPLEFNGVGAGPDMVNTDSSGTVTSEEWREYIEAQFFITVRASNEVEKEPIYESIRQAFGKYQFGAWSEKDLHKRVIDVDVLDSTTADDGDAENRIRGETVEVRVQFYRPYQYSTDNITTVEHNISLDLDLSSSDITYTTT